MKKILFVSLIALSLTVTLGSLSCSPKYSGPEASLRFGGLPSGSATLVYIAQEQDFFADYGLDVDVIHYDTGAATTDALLKQELEIAWSAELPVVRKALAAGPISIFASLSKFDDEVLYARKDRGIENIADLKGKRIGVPRNTIAEFYLTRFLTLNGMTIEDVLIFDVPPSQSIDALNSADYDAVVTWQPYSTQIQTQMSAQVVYWSVQSSQSGYGVLTARNDWLDENPELTERFLKSLVEAEDYLRRNPAASRDIVKDRLDFEDDLMDIIWHADEFSITLEQSLIIAMEHEARWLIENKMTTATQVPDFLDYIDEDALKDLKPEAVNIIR